MARLGLRKRIFIILFFHNGTACILLGLTEAILVEEIETNFENFVRNRFRYVKKNITRFNKQGMAQVGAARKARNIHGVRYF